MNNIISIISLLTADVWYSNWGVNIYDPVTGNTSQDMKIVVADGFSLTLDPVDGKYRFGITGIPAVSGALDAYSSRLTTDESNLSALASTVGIHSSQISALQSGLSAATGNIATLQGQMTSVQSGLTAVSGTVSGQASTISTLSAAVATLSGQIGQTPVGATGAAPSGYVGEFREVCTARSSGVTLTGTVATISTLSLPAGDWLISAMPNISGALVGTSFTAAINTSTSMPSNASNGGDRTESPVVASLNADLGLTIINRHKTFSSTTNVYLVATAGLSVGTGLGSGCISALRIH